jgi:hypothetical protein
MPFNLFTGVIEGKSFVAAQTLIPTEQFRAGMVVDTFTPLPGSKVPKFENGWLMRTVAPDLSPELMTAVVESAGGEVIEVGEVRREEVGGFVGSKVVERALRPHQLEPETPEL